MGDEVRRFSCGQFIAGAALGIAGGFAGNLAAMAISGALFGRIDKHNPVVGFGIGLVPGIALMVIAMRLRGGSMSYGILAVSVIVLLTGGLCGGGVAGLFG